MLCAFVYYMPYPLSNLSLLQKCEEIAYMLRSIDLNTSVEHSSVHTFTTQAVARLSPNDATLPQVLTVCEMVKRGIGVVRNQHTRVRLVEHLLKKSNYCCSSS